MAGMSETKRKVLDALTLSLITLVCTFAPFFSSAQTTKQNEVHILAPNGYLSPDVISAFEKSHKAKVSISVYYNDKMMDSLIDGNRGTAFDVLIANEAGADHAGADELIAAVDGGWTGFDIAIATPAILPIPTVLDNAVDRA